MFPILEHINKMEILNEGGLVESPSSPKTPVTDAALQDEWVVVRSSSYAGMQYNDIYIAYPIHKHPNL